ncbi:uncharacterized protein BJ212DRAFT_1388108, partial [Suillus subaureus]
MQDQLHYLRLSCHWWIANPSVRWQMLSFSVLWDCAHTDSDVTWQTDDDGTGSITASDLYYQLHSIHQLLPHLHYP